MSGEGEAAGNVLTGVVVAATVERAVNAPGEHAASETHRKCLNCDSELTGAYCARCGQAAHIHRSLGSLGHDVLHGVFHFEGKFWTTLPELLFHPGRLTRRYIDGQRARFVSPMALFLFSVFIMFAVFSFTGGALVGETRIDTDAINTVRSSWQAGPIAATEAKLAELRKELTTPVTPERRAVIEQEIVELEEGRRVMEALRGGDFSALDPEAAPRSAQARLQLESATKRITAVFDEVIRNPELLLYKLKTNGYKFSWALVPLSVPFMWLLFFWRRDVHMYDHAVFVTYSMSFMMLLFVMLSIASAFGAGGGTWALVLGIIPPIHMYKQLRGTYGLSRAGAWLRLFALMIMIVIIAVLYLGFLLVVGVLT